MKKSALTFTIILISMALFASQELFGSSTSFYTPDSLAIVQGDSTEYEITIIETGFDNWILTNAKPKWYFSNDYYRNKNNFSVVNWNNKVRETMHTPPYEEEIQYNPNIDYGLDVNYQLYWYFQFVQEKYELK